jgi:hypothetical protein
LYKNDEAGVKLCIEKGVNMVIRDDKCIDEEDGSMTWLQVRPRCFTTFFMIDINFSIFSIIFQTGKSD